VRCAMLLLLLLLCLLRRRARVGGEERVGHPPNDWRTHTHTHRDERNGESSAPLRLPRRVQSVSVCSPARAWLGCWAGQEKRRPRAAKAQWSDPPAPETPRRHRRHAAGGTQATCSLAHALRVHVDHEVAAAALLLLPIGPVRTTLSRDHSGRRKYNSDEQTVQNRHE
jgi:hypothetical protein